MQKTVRFIYHTGIANDIFENAVLLGSWNSAGDFSNEWTAWAMTKLRGEAGDFSFVAEASLQSGTPGQIFLWGVKLDGPTGKQQWGILTEIQDPHSQACHRAFSIEDSEPPEQHYYLNHSRRIGAQKWGEGIHFSVWAPNARSVSVCIGNLWKHTSDDIPSSLIHEGNTPALAPFDRNAIYGGFISDSGEGQHPAFGPFPMHREGMNVWSTSTEDPSLASFDRFDHIPYMYRVTKDDGQIVYRTDLFSRCQIGSGPERPLGSYEGKTGDLDGSISCSVVIDPDKVAANFSEAVWPEENWITQEEFFIAHPAMPDLRRLRLQDLVIYELHIGALGIARGPQNPGTLEDACAFLDYLVDLGVNAIELLPLSEFGGDGAGWGYSTSHYYAIEYAGGGRDQYKWFVRECHRRGMVVILDVVYNHYNHRADRAEWMYDTNSHTKNSYYWYEGSSEAHPDFDARVRPEQKGEGGYLDNLSSGWAPRYWEEHVRNMFVSSAIALAQEFHIDGLRVDQTTSIRLYNSLHSNGTTVPSANAFGAKLLREFARSLNFVCPHVKLIAEDHGDDQEVTQPLEHGGCGFDGRWYADFYHHLIGDGDKGSEYARLIVTSGRGDDDPLAMDLFASALQATAGGQNVVYHQSHDEAGNGRHTDRTIALAANGAPLFGETRRFAEARCRFAAGVTLLSAGIPMFLFGEEVGAQEQFLYNRVLEHREDYERLRRTTGRSLFEYYSRLIRLRLAHPGLRSANIEVFFSHNQHRLLAFRRWGEGEEFLIVASLNNRPFAGTAYIFRSEHIRTGLWREIFNSDSSQFGGDDVGNAGATLESFPGMFSCVVPANGLLVFQSELF